MRNWYIYLVVVIGGASVLSIEILGTRIIGPFYGVSLYLWSALIGVTLAALSLGYALGGRWADRGPRMTRLSLLLGLAGVWICAIPWLRVPALAASEALGLRAAVLVTATVLFAPPLTLLGMVSPYAIRLKVSNVESVGQTAGDLYAISTISSVVAAVVTGFFLIPSVGVSRLTFLIGAVLILTALVGIAVRQRGAVAVGITLLILGGAAGAFALSPSSRPDPEHGILAIEDSPYAEIRVVEKNGLRFMLIDGGTHTIVDPDTWESYFPYVNVMDLTRRFFDAPGNALLVGLGGGSVAKRFAGEGWDVDAVEIDPVVARFAGTHFGLEPPEADVYTMDGRQYLMETEQRYDLIIMDAFGSSSIPFHLVTTEAFGLMRSRLTEDGILAMNIEAVGWDDVLVRSLAATLQTRFQDVVVLPMAEPPDRIGNLVLMAADRPVELGYELTAPESRNSAEYHRVHAWDNRFRVDPEGEIILTDELNPVDIWAERINLVARRNLHEYFSAQGVSW